MKTNNHRIAVCTEDKLIKTIFILYSERERIKIEPILEEIRMIMIINYIEEWQKHLMNIIKN